MQIKQISIVIFLDILKKIYNIFKKLMRKLFRKINKHFFWKKFEIQKNMEGYRVIFTKYDRQVLILYKDLVFFHKKG